jgi:hypothetical protein
VTRSSSRLYGVEETTPGATIQRLAAPSAVDYAQVRCLGSMPVTILRKETHILDIDPLGTVLTDVKASETLTDLPLAADANTLHLRTFSDVS